MDVIGDIKRQVENAHQDLGGLDSYREDKLFKAGVDMMYDQVADIIRCAETKRNNGGAAQKYIIVNNDCFCGIAFHMFQGSETEMIAEMMKKAEEIAQKMAEDFGEIMDVTFDKRTQSWRVDVMNNQDAVEESVVAKALREIKMVKTKNPLTQKELKEMAGKPVYCPELESYGIVKYDTKGRWAEIPFLVGVFHQYGCSVTFEYNILERGLKCYEITELN